MDDDMTTDFVLKFCLGCGIQLKSWKEGDDEFCGAYEQCMPLYELKKANKCIATLEAALAQQDALLSEAYVLFERVLDGLADQHSGYVEIMKFLEKVWNVKFFDQARGVKDEAGRD